MKLSFAVAASFIVTAVAAPADVTCPDAKAAVPLLRGYSRLNKDHFYVTSQEEMNAANGYALKQSPGRVFTTQVPGTVPLFRLRNAAGLDHLYTANETERDDSVANNGYVYEGVTAYIFPSQICDSRPLYRAYSPRESDHYYSSDSWEMGYLGDTYGSLMEGVTGYVL
ncbi:hypothetical protein HGRIS_006291 [Hohenbuehelia grisea]|uniref:DUF5648 domain-containing protein n=1 Tax=Hohenbuehelia grisea TaxID=104357 RepID=A0ABR3K0M6_9AGAR